MPIRLLPDRATRDNARSRSSHPLHTSLLCLVLHQYFLISSEAPEFTLEYTSETDSPLLALLRTCLAALRHSYSTPLQIYFFPPHSDASMPACSIRKSPPTLSYNSTTHLFLRCTLTPKDVSYIHPVCSPTRCLASAPECLFS
ncbi:hypothetical protein Tco_0190976 [Tanacetum coccineum]